MPDLFFDQEFRALVPPLQTAELEELEASLVREGNRDAIVVWKEKRILLDGHHRYDLCHKHGIPLKPPHELSLPDRRAAMVWIIDNQLARRNLVPYQRVALELKRADIKARAKDRQLSGLKQYQVNTVFQNSGKREETHTDREVAKRAGVSHDTVWKVRHIEEKATPEQKERLAKGDATINQVFVELRRQEVRERVAGTNWPDGKYRVIYADPPWQYSNTQPDYHTVQDDHYPTMPLADICALPVRDLALEDAVLFLWATSPILEEAFRVVRAWGFQYKASFVWDKVKHNMGHYNSVRHELLLVAVRGSCPPDIPRLFDSVQVIERTNHSAKPEEFRGIIDTLYPHGRRIELFARVKAEGWEQYGNQVPAGISGL